MVIAAKEVYCSLLSSDSESSWPVLSSGSEMDYCDHTRCYNFTVRQNDDLEAHTNNNFRQEPPVSFNDADNDASIASNTDSIASIASSKDDESPVSSGISVKSPVLKSVNPGEATTPSKPIQITQTLRSPSTRVPSEIMNEFFTVKAKVQRVSIHNSMIPLCNHWFPDFFDILLPQVPNDNHNPTHIVGMVAETTFNLAAIPIRRIEASTHPTNADHDRWAIVIPGNVVTSDEFAHDAIELTCVLLRPTRLQKL